MPSQIEYLLLILKNPFHGLALQCVAAKVSMISDMIKEKKKRCTRLGEYSCVFNQSDVQCQCQGY